jgi:hypothetical protein
MQEIRRAKHPSHFDFLGVMGGDPGSEHGDDDEGGKEETAGEKEGVGCVATRPRR